MKSKKIKVKNTVCIAVGMLILFALQSCHNDKSKDQANAKADRHSLLIIKNGMVDGLCEIKASGLVITNSNNHRLIDLAKTIITEQTIIDSGLMKLKSAYQITVKDTITPVDATWIASLSKKSGEAFDKQYIASMIGIHRTDSALYTFVAVDAKPDVKKFAGQTFPGVKKRLDSALAIWPSLK